MNTKFLITLAVLFLLTKSFGQNNYYYYYKGEKKFLTLDKKHINIFTEPSFEKTSISNLNVKDFNLKNTDVPTEKWTKIEFESQPSDLEFLAKTIALKNNPNVNGVGLYFKTSSTESIGTSNIFYVKLKSLNDFPLLQAKAIEKNVVITKQNEFMPLWYELKTTKNTIENSIQLTNFFYETGLFEAIDPSFIFPFEFEPENITNSNNQNQQLACPTNDPLLSQQWGLEKIKACQAWDISQGQNIKVAVVDQGIQLNHVDLAANIWPQSYNFTTSTLINSPSVTYGQHGTRMAGIIGAVKDNNLQMAGVAPQSKLISLSVSTSIISTLNSPLGGGANVIINFSNAINQAVTMDADVLNCSWNLNNYINNDLSSFYSSLIENSIDGALTNGRNGLGCIVVFASGNNGSTTLSYPANYETKILTVGNSQFDDTRFCGSINNCSSSGIKLDVVAPGTNTYSTILNNGVETNTGTSESAAFVSGIAALILAVNPCLTGEQVRNIIESTSQKLGGYSYVTSPNRINGTWNNEMGYGVVNAFAAVQMAQLTQSASLDLFIRDTENDLGLEPDTTSPILWDSPDIFVRNLEDFDPIYPTYYSETPYYSFPFPNYVYVRVHNKSCFSSLGTEQVKLYYSLPTTTSQNTSTFRSSFMPITGYQTVLIGTQTVPAIAGGGDVVIKFNWDFPDPFGITACTDNTFNTSLWAKIIAVNDPNNVAETSNMYNNIKNNNNIAGKHVIPISYPSLISTNPNTSNSLSVGNPFNEIRNFRIEMIKEDTETGKNIYDEAEIKFKMDEILYNAWLRGGQIAQKIVATDE